MLYTEWHSVRLLPYTDTNIATPQTYYHTLIDTELQMVALLPQRNSAQFILAPQWHAVWTELLHGHKQLLLLLVVVQLQDDGLSSWDAVMNGQEMGGRDTITEGYARTNVIGSRTSFVIASVRSSIHWKLCIYG